MTRDPPGCLPVAPLQMAAMGQCEWRHPSWWRCVAVALSGCHTLPCLLLATSSHPTTYKHVQPMPVWCWGSVVDAVPTLNWHEGLTLILGQSRRRWANITLANGQCFVSAGRCSMFMLTSPALGKCWMNVYDDSRLKWTLRFCLCSINYGQSSFKSNWTCKAEFHAHQCSGLPLNKKHLKAQRFTCLPYYWLVFMYVLNILVCVSRNSNSEWSL